MQTVLTVLYVTGRHIFFDSEFGIAKMFCEDSAFKAFYDAVKPKLRRHQGVCLKLV